MLLFAGRITCMTFGFVSWMEIQVAGLMPGHWDIDFQSGVTE